MKLTRRSLFKGLMGLPVLAVLGSKDAKPDRSGVFSRTFETITVPTTAGNTNSIHWQHITVYREAQDRITFGPVYWSDETQRPVGERVL